MTNNKNPIKGERHPKRYESHKYWGRKPANIVRQYISRYSTEGQLVLDPFCGSGVTIFEALALGREAIGYDLNPMACFISDSLITGEVDLAALENCGKEILNKTENQFPYYEVRCGCGATGVLINGVWRNSRYIAKYYVCPRCGYRLSETTEFDQQQVENVVIPTNLWYPRDRLPPNADAGYVHELFTKRNLLALSLLFQEIRQAPDEITKKLLLYTFTSNLAFASKLIPVNEKRFKQGRNCTGVWGFKRFWLPDFHVENNVFNYFRNRLERTIVAKKETNYLLKNNLTRARVINHSSTYMPELSNQTVDFIFTDPPFGDMIPYLNLSTLWNAWLQFKVDGEDEIIIDQHRDASEYCRKLTSVFKECYRVLKEEGLLVVTFNNKSMKVWRMLLEAIHQANFSLQECLPAEDGEVSFTQTTKSARGSLRGHFVYVFKKQEKSTNRQAIGLEEAAAQIENELVNFISGAAKDITGIYNHIIPFMVNHDLLHPYLADNTIEQILANRAELVTQTQQRVIEGEMVELKSYYWIIKL